MPEQQDLDHRVERLTYELAEVRTFLFGPTGQNGMNSRLKGLEAKIDGLDRKLDDIRLAELKDLSETVGHWRNAALVIFTTLILAASTLVATLH